ncbi:MAG: thioredoxin [Chloroflexota bacterium]|jgi:thioredoxin
MGIFDFLKKDKPTKRAAIIDVSDDNFKQQVIRRSYKTTVVVDFWAAWCGPCRTLGPMLERIAEEPDGDFILAKLNTEHNQNTAAQYHIHSIPAVKAFRNGQVVEEFTGAIPEVLVRRFIEKATSTSPPAIQIKASSNPTKRLQQGKQHLKKGRGFEAFLVLSDFPDSPEKEEAEQLHRLARFMVDMGDGDGLTGLEELDDKYLAAAKALRQSKPSQAIDQLRAALEVGDTIDETYTSEIIESIFVLLGEKQTKNQQNRKQTDAAQAA